MSKTLPGGFALALAAIAFAVTPMAAQAAGTHFYKNGTKITEGTQIATISWGTLTTRNSAGERSSAGQVTCHTDVGGYVENPTGGGPGLGVTQNFSTSECSMAECPDEMRSEGIINDHENAFRNATGNAIGWRGEVIEEGTTSRLRTTGLEIVIQCWTGGPSGPGNLSTTERGTPLNTPFAFLGEWTPKLKNSANGKASSPSKTEFGTGSGELISEGFGLLTIFGELKTIGYGEEETITTGA